MKAVIELPDRLVDALKNRAALRGSTIQDVILEMIEREIGDTSDVDVQRHRVELPLIHSNAPGSLRSLTNAQIDDLVDGLAVDLLSAAPAL